MADIVQDEIRIGEGLDCKAQLACGGVELETSGGPDAFFRVVVDPGGGQLYSDGYSEWKYSDQVLQDGSALNEERWLETLFGERRYGTVWCGLRKGRSLEGAKWIQTERAATRALATC